MSQQLQKALVVPAKGSSYTLIEKSIPIPGPPDVLIKLEGVALNPFEWRVPLFPPLFDNFKLPAYLGTDGAGVVVEVGSGVEIIRKGDRVLFQGWFNPKNSTYQQYALAPVNFITKLPSTISTLEAASLPLATITAAFSFALPDPAIPSLTEAGKETYSPIFDGRAGAGIKPFWEESAKGIKAGQPILILGGSSSVGQLAIQIANYLGYSPIITTSSSKHSDFLASLGATHVLDRATSASVIQELSNGSPISIAYDAVGALTQVHVDILAPGATCILCDPQVGTKLTYNDGKKFVKPFGALHYYKDLGASLMGSLEGLLESGVIKPNRVEKVPGGLAGIPDGLGRMQRGEYSGVKLVVDPAETPS